MVAVDKGGVHGTRGNYNNNKYTLVTTWIGNMTLRYIISLKVQEVCNEKSYGDVTTFRTLIYYAENYRRNYVKSTNKR